jgi:ribosomal protein L37AE/L43A
MSTPFLENLLIKLTERYPRITFKAGAVFCWSPKQCEVQYVRPDTSIPRTLSNNDSAACYALLHEVGHALLDHRKYQTDFELVTMEVSAWKEAKRIAPDFGIVSIDEDHIQDSLDSYRDWLYRRSVCPVCTTKALQQDDTLIYRCHNCHTTWQVAASRFCRPYRQSRATAATTPIVT